MKILHRGAEAILYLDKLNGEEVLVKERISKGYRIKPLDDKLRKERTRSEVNLLDKARRSGVNVPRVMDHFDYKIFMEYLKLKTLKTEFHKHPEMAREIGEIVAKLHEAGIIHGDLTTSNILLDTEGRVGVTKPLGKVSSKTETATPVSLVEGSLFLIDFSLGKISKKVEDQATDLYLLYEALISTHHEMAESAWKMILDVYRKYANSKQVIARLDQISKRRRYRTES